jgi:hypothetical protein
VSYYFPHILLFCVFLAALIPVLYYYRRRHPHPRFRPGAGEMLMIVVFALAIGGPACYFLGNVFRGGGNTKKSSGKPDEGADLFKTTIPGLDEKEQEEKNRRSNN